MGIPVALSWSGGKDSARALWELQRDPAHEVRCLLTTVTDEYDRISMHGVRQVLLERQAAAAGLPLVQVRIPPECPNEIYEARMAQAFDSPPLDSIGHVAFADLFLEDIRAYREERLAQAGREGVWPLWGKDTMVLAREFVLAGFQAILCCVDPNLLDPSFAGRSYDEDLLADLPEEADPCGENGEFHTFVHTGPIYREPIPVIRGEVVTRDGFVFCDLF